MRTLNAREKNLSILVTLCVMSWLSTNVSRNLKHRTDELQAEVVAAQERLRQAQSMLATPAPAASPAAAPAPLSAVQETAPTLTLLTDLTSPSESSRIRVVNVERIADKSYRLTLEGKFPEMMRYLSYLERKDSRFRVGSAQLEKLTKPDTAVLNTPGAIIRETGDEPAREVRGVFKVSYQS